MSTIKLPPPSFYHRHEDICGNEVGPPTPFWNQTAVEEAVRQGLEHAAVIADRQHFGGEHDDDLSWTDCAALIAVKIRALIPEKDHGEST